MSIVRSVRWTAMAIACGLLAVAPVCVTWAQSARTPPIVTPQPRDVALKSGLKVRYYTHTTYKIAEFLGLASGRPGTPGDDIAAIDFPDLGPGAYVMGTKQSERIGAVIDGLIQFDVAGTYMMAMVINDMVQLNIGGDLLIEKDWDGTPSRMGEPVAVAIKEPGWHQLHVVYYQRAGTAALQLFWKKPGQAGDFVIVPKEAYAHIAE